MNMREKLARVLADADGMHPDAVSNDEDELPIWTTYLGVADAVLDALMEPTDEMIALAAEQEYAGESEGENCNLDVGDYLAGIVWRTMIQAAKSGQ